MGVSLGNVIITEHGLGWNASPVIVLHDRMGKNALPLTFYTSLFLWKKKEFEYYTISIVTYIRA